MAKDGRDLLQVLKAELNFLEAGGYARGQRTSWFPPFIFEDSPTCQGFNPEARPELCAGCVLLSLVPPEQRTAEIPCRHVPLNAAGDTVESFYQAHTQQELEWALDKWLRGKIKELESQTPAAKDKRDN